MNNFKFIFMLTHNDKTISDAFVRLKDVLNSGVLDIGFKDIGLPFSELKKLSNEIKLAGANVYLEVVSLDKESEIKSAKAALELNVDVLMGGIHPEVVIPIIKDSRILYFPFCGKVIGHPSILTGTADEIIAYAQYLDKMDNVDGIDMLAYRFDGDVPDLIQSVCSIVSKPVYIAGSINSKDKINAVIKGGAAGFTVGTAALDGVFPGKTNALNDQINYIKKIIDDSIN